MVHAAWGTEVTQLRSRSLVKIAAIGALIVALGLAGCGRKGGLDPPPSTSAAGEPPAGASVPAPEIGPDGKPLPPLSPDVPRRRTFIDFLID